MYILKRPLIFKINMYIIYFIKMDYFMLMYKLMFVIMIIIIINKMNVINMLYVKCNVNKYYELSSNVSKKKK
ncbi:hypothetical protein BDC45DRAFT_513725 [Circinella umbellata]|nr:hypothetical protein BDC45DRAFT_513725 [Circinella umbellata]